MRLSLVACVLSSALSALAHGSIRKLVVDGRTYWAPSSVDEKHGAGTIAFAPALPKKPFVNDPSEAGMACQANPKAPTLFAPARAGSEIRFAWNPWFVTHKGPLLTYMAPYDGPAGDVNVNALQWFKISEKGLGADGKTWATDEMIANGNVSSTVIPHDLKRGKYVLRHELIALHYSTEDSLYHKKEDRLLGPQHYIHCFNIMVYGSGSGVPEDTVSFPGAYRPFKQEPGLYFDIWRGVSPYPIPGPRPYVPQGAALQLAPLPPSTQSPTGNAARDKQYELAVKASYTRSDDFTAQVNRRKLGYGGNPDMKSPPPGSVPPGATVKGASWRATENGLAGEEA